MPKGKNKARSRFSNECHPSPFSRNPYGYPPLGEPLQLRSRPFQPSQNMSAWYSRPPPPFFAEAQHFPRFRVEPYSRTYNGTNWNNFNETARSNEEYSTISQIRECPPNARPCKDVDQCNSKLKERPRKSLSPPIIEKNDKASTAVRDKLSEIIQGGSAEQVACSLNMVDITVPSSNEKQTDSLRNTSDEPKILSKRISPIVSKESCTLTGKNDSNAERRADLLVRAEALCKEMREKRLEKAMEKVEREAKRKKTKESELQAEIDNLTYKSNEKKKGIISSDSLRSSALSLSQARLDLDKSVIVASKSDSLVLNTELVKTTVPGQCLSQSPPISKRIGEKYMQKSPISHGKLNLSKTELIKLIESPRTRKEELLLEAIMKQHRKIKSYRDRQNILLRGTDQPSESKNIEVEDLPEEIQLEIEELLEKEGSSFGKEIIDLLKVKEEGEKQTEMSVEPSPDHVSNVKSYQKLVQEPVHIDQSYGDNDNAIHQPLPLQEDKECTVPSLKEHNNLAISSNTNTNTNVPSLGHKSSASSLYNEIVQNSETKPVSESCSDHSKNNKPKRLSEVMMEGSTTNEKLLNPEEKTTSSIEKLLKNLDYIGEQLNTINSSPVGVPTDISLSKKDEVYTTATSSGTSVDELVKSLTKEIKDEMKSECLPNMGTVLPPDYTVKTLCSPTKIQTPVSMASSSLSKEAESIASSTSTCSTLPLTVSDLSVPPVHVITPETAQLDLLYNITPADQMINIEPCPSDIDTMLQHQPQFPDTSNPIEIKPQDSKDEEMPTFSNETPGVVVTDPVVGSSDHDTYEQTITESSDMDTDTLLSKRRSEPCLQNESKRQKFNQQDSHVDPLPGNQLSQLYSITLEEDKIHDRMKENDASIVKLEEMLRKTQEQLEKRKELRQNLLSMEEDLREKRRAILKGAIQSTTASSQESGGDTSVNRYESSNVINVEPDTTVEIIPDIKPESNDCLSQQTVKQFVDETSSCGSRGCFKKPNKPVKPKYRRNPRRSSTETSESDCSLGGKIRALSTKVYSVSDNTDDTEQKKLINVNKIKKKKKKSDRDKLYCKSRNVNSSNSDSSKRFVKKKSKRTDISPEVVDYLHASSSTDVEWGNSEKEKLKYINIPKTAGDQASKVNTPKAPLQLERMVMGHNLKPFGKEEVTNLSSLLCDENYVYTGGQRQIKKWTLDGTVLWTKRVPAYVKDLVLFKDGTESLLLFLCERKQGLYSFNVENVDEEPLKIASPEGNRFKNIKVDWKHLFAISNENKVILYKKNTLRRNKNLRKVNIYAVSSLKSNVTCMETAEFEGEKMLFAGLNNGSIVCREALTGVLIRIFENHVTKPKQIQVVGNYMYSLCKKQLLVHHLQTGIIVHSYANKCVSFIVHNNKVVVSTMNGQICTFQEKNFKMVKIILMPAESEQQQFLSSFGAEKIISAPKSGPVFVVTIPKGKTFQCQYGRCSQVYAHNCDLKRHLVEDHLLGGSTVHTCLWHSCCTYFTVDDDGNVCLDEAKQHLELHADQ